MYRFFFFCASNQSINWSVIQLKNIDLQVFLLGLGFLNLIFQTKQRESILQVPNVQIFNYWNYRVRWHVYFFRVSIFLKLKCWSSLLTTYVWFYYISVMGYTEANAGAKLIKPSNSNNVPTSILSNFPLSF